MSKAQAQFVCQSCGASYGKWSGHCAACGEWNSIIEEAGSAGFTKLKQSGGTIITLESLQGAADRTPRKETGMTELNRVLGGGLVKGSAVLIGGDPGIGKSTLLLQVACHLQQHGLECMYFTGEESTAQIRMRAERLGLSNAPLSLASATSVSDILSTLKKSRPDVVIIDSIQTMFLDTIDSSPGTVSQVRSSAAELIQAAKQSGICLLLVGHVTKDGQIAGPKVLEHMVDTVLYFEGERGHEFRILRAVKNRYGGVNEIGVFEMSDKGLREVSNPSSLFISGKAGEVSGSVIFAGMEGTRPLLVEIQALVSPSQMATPRRAVVGWDVNRLAMILAVLQTRCGARLADKEVYLNVAGGIRVNEPAADLAVSAAILSSLTNLPLPEKTVIFGEVGLSGEVRPVAQTDSRLKEADKLGFARAILPPDTKNPRKDFILTPIAYIHQLQKIFASQGSD